MRIGAGIDLSALAARPMSSLWNYDLTQGTLPAVLSVARASAGTFVNSAGIIAVAAADEARFDYDPLTLVCTGLLVEPQRTNLIAYSGGGSTGWSGTNGAKSNASISLPDGSAGGIRFTENTSNASHNLTTSNANISTSGARYACSIFGFADQRNIVTIRGMGLGTNGVLANVLTGYSESTGANTFPIYGAQRRADGWCRAYGVGTATSTGTALFGMAAATGGTAAYAGDGASGMFFWGAQQEAIPSGEPDCPTSYISTAAGVSQTRDADVVTVLDTSRQYSITYEPLAGGSLQTITVAAGQQPPVIYGRWREIRQL